MRVEDELRSIDFFDHMEFDRTILMEYLSFATTLTWLKSLPVCTELELMDERFTSFL